MTKWRLKSSTGVLAIAGLGALLAGLIAGAAGCGGSSGSGAAALAIHLFVADQSNNRVLRFSEPFTNGMDANRVIGQPDFTSNALDTTQSSLRTAQGIGFDASGYLWVADFFNNRVVSFEPPFTNGMDASTVLGQPDFTSNGSATTQSGLSQPCGVASDGSGYLWVADSDNNRVVAFEPPFSNGMNASIVIGQSDFTSNGSATTQSGLSDPCRVAFDSAGNLWVADLLNNRVLEFASPFSNGMNATLVIGQSNFTSMTGVATQSGLDGPAAMAFDAAGSLWVADSANHRVLKFEPPFSTGMNASLVLGQMDFSSSGFGVTQDEMQNPFGLAFDRDGNLWIADTNNYRVLEFEPPFSTGMNASLVVGQDDFTSAETGTTQSRFMAPLSVAFAP